MTTDTTTNPGARTRVCVLAAVAAFVAITYALATPTTVGVTVEKAGVVTEDGTSLRGFAIAFLVLQVLAAVAALAGVFLVRKGRDGLARRVLGIAGVLGLVPAVLPGVLALIARHLLGTVGSAVVGDRPRSAT